MNGTRKIIDYRGIVKKIACLACARENGEISLGDILKSKYFDAHQDYTIPIPEFIIISSRRHIQSIDEFTNKERMDFIKFLCRIRSALRKILKVKVVYIYQREDTRNHFHVCMLPRYDWMTKKFGRKIGSIRPIISFAKKNLKTNSNIAKTEEATQKLKHFLSNNSPGKNARKKH